jgi:hypothetical protein
MPKSSRRSGAEVAVLGARGKLSAVGGLVHAAGEDDRMNNERPLFQHPPWMVGIMLILGVMSLLVGLTIDPFWLVMGGPAILTLVVYIGARVALSIRLRRRPMAPGPDADELRGDAHSQWVSQDEEGGPEPGSTHGPDR